MSFEARIKELGLVLPEPPRPAGHFVPAVQPSLHFALSAGLSNSNLSQECAT